MWRDSFLFSLLFLCLSLDYAEPNRVRERNPWDLLIFTQQWPLSTCKEWKQLNPAHTCTLPKDVDRWTVHGVWPTKLHTIGPAYCNRSWHFDPEQVKPIEANLSVLWTNIEAEPLTYSLWAHEWTKHGTCAAVLQALNTEFKYFSKGLEWIEQYTMNNILGPSNIVPTNKKKYPIIDIHTAVKGKLKVNPAIECRVFDGKSWLMEIRICFNKTLHLSDCDGIVGFRKGSPQNNDTKVLTNCNLNEEILYPLDMELKAPPNKLYVQLYKLTSWLQWFTL